MTPSLTHLMGQQHGVFTRAQALACGISPDEFRRNVERGEWCRVRRGAYTTPEIWTAASSADRQILGFQAAAIQLEPPVVASHETAAAIHAIELWEPAHDWIHVTRPDRSARREGGVWHHQAELPETEDVVVDGLRATSIPRTALDLARYAPDREHALVAVDSALRASGGAYDDRAALLERMRAMHLDRIDWPGARFAGGAVASADPRCGSVGESRSRVRFEEAGLPVPMTQAYVYNEGGVLVGISDFVFAEQKTIAEFDGRMKYGLDGLADDAMSARLWAEKLRQDELARLGWEIVRLIWADLYHVARIAAQMRAAFARADRSGPVRGSFSLIPH